jgi:hypothetical protein
MELQKGPTMTRTQDVPRSRPHQPFPHSELGSNASVLLRGPMRPPIRSQATSLRQCPRISAVRLHPLAPCRIHRGEVRVRHDHLMTELLQAPCRWAFRTPGRTWLFPATRHRRQRSDARAARRTRGRTWRAQDSRPCSSHTASSTRVTTALRAAPSRPSGPQCRTPR